MRSNRITRNTRREFDERIRHETEKNIAYYAARPDQIEQRLRELDEEWDIERMLMCNAAALTLFSVTMSILGRRRYTLMSALIPTFLLQHAIQGWCPPLNLFRRLGFRTRTEIDSERYALRAFRGDFRELPGDQDSSRFEDVTRLLETMQR